MISSFCWVEVLHFILESKHHPQLWHNYYYVGLYVPFLKFCMYVQFLFIPTVPPQWRYHSPLFRYHPPLCHCSEGSEDIILHCATTVKMMTSSSTVPPQQRWWHPPPLCHCREDDDILLHCATTVKTMSPYDVHSHHVLFYLVFGTVPVHVKQWQHKIVI